MRSGNINIRDGRLYNAGINGYYWSSRAAAFTSDTSATAYNLAFNASNTYPSNGPNNRWNGFSLRCFLAVGADLFAKSSQLCLQLKDFLCYPKKMMKIISKQGRLTANGVILEKHEMRTIVFLLNQGYNIELIPKSNQYGIHTPDIKMLNLKWEIKCPKGEGKYLIQNTLHRAAHQSSNIIVDLRRTKKFQTKCLQELEKVFKDLKSLKRLKIITKNQKIVDFIK